MKCLIFLFTLGVFFLPRPATAELITFENGDQLRGSVVSLDSKEVKLQNANLGLVTIPRAKIASIQLKENAAGATAAGSGTNQFLARTSAPAAANDPISQLKGGVDPKILEQVQNQFLGTAGPEANAMFGEMLSGLASGAINLNDLREQARSTLDELKKVQHELGEEDGGMFSMYTGILERFIAAGTNSATKASSPTNAPAQNGGKPALKQSPPGKLEFQKPPPRKTVDEED